MAKKDEVEFDDFELDDFDFDDAAFDGELSLKDDRKPATIIAQSAFEGFTSRLANPRLVADSLGEALPDGYRKILDVKDALENAVEETREALKPAKQSIKSMLLRNRAFAQKVLPKGMYQRLNEWATGDQWKTEQIDERSAEIQASTSGVFEAYMAKHVTEEIHRKEDQIVEAERFEKTSNIYDRIRQGIDKLVAFNDDALIKVKQKEIEIAYRQLYALTDILEITREKAETDRLQLAAISKNTALPETQKIKLSENLHQNIRERAVGKVGDFFSGFTDKFRKRLINNIAGKINEFAQGAGDLLDQVPLNDMFGDGNKAGDDFGMDPRSMILEMGGDEIGSSLFEGVMNKWIKPFVQKEMDKGDDSKFAKFGHKANYWLTNPEDSIRYFLRNYKEKDGFLGRILNFAVETAREAQPGYRRPETLQQTLVRDADEAVHLSRKMERSIVEIIPGFLERQLHVLSQIKDGPTAERIVYNPYEGRFTVAKKRTDMVKRLVDDPRTRESIAQSSNEIIDILRGDTEFTPAQRQALGDYLIQRRSQGQDLDIRTLAKEFTHKSLSKEEVEFVRKAISTRFLDGDKIRDDIGTYNRGIEYKTAVDQLTGQLPDLMPIVMKLQAAGYLEDLIETGIVKDNKIDYASILGSIMQDYLQGARDGTPSPVMEVLSDSLDRRRHLSGTAVQDAHSRIQEAQAAERDGGTRYGRNHRGHYGRKPKRQERRIQERLVEGTDANVTPTDANVMPTDVQVNEPAPEDTPIATLSALHGQGDLNSILNQFRLTNHADLSQIKATLQTVTAAFSQWPGQTPTPVQQSTPTTVLASDSLEGIHSRLDSIRQAILDCCTVGVNEEQRDILLQILMAHSGELSEEITNSQAIRKLANTVWERSKSLGKRGGQLLRSYYQNVFKGLKWVKDKAKKPLTAIKDFAIKKAGQAWDWAIGKKNQMEVYLRGVAGPVLTEHKMRAGHYIDEITGKVIQKFEDIKGPVRDQYENVMVITADQLDKIYTGDGRTVVGKVLDMVGNYYSNAFKFAGQAWGAVKKVATFAQKLVDPIVDIYVVGEDTPRLTALLLNRGFYRSSVTGKPIFRARDIDGTVKDREGNVVLTAEDMRRGLVDKDGKPFKALSAVIGEKIRSAAQLPGKLIKGTLSAYSTVAKGIGNVITGVGNRIRAKGPEGILINRADNQLLILQDIRDIINQWSGLNITYRPPVSEEESLKDFGTPGAGLKGLWSRLKDKVKGKLPDSVDEAYQKATDKMGGWKDRLLEKTRNAKNRVLDKARNIRDTYRQYQEDDVTPIATEASTDIPDQEPLFSDEQWRAARERVINDPDNPLPQRKPWRQRLKERADQIRAKTEAYGETHHSGLMGRLRQLRNEARERRQSIQQKLQDSPAVNTATNTVREGGKSLLGWIGTGLSKGAAFLNDRKDDVKAKLKEKLQKPAVVDENDPNFTGPPRPQPNEDDTPPEDNPEDNPEAERHDELMDNQRRMAGSLEAIEEHTRTRNEEENPNSLLGRLKAMREKRKAKKDGRLVEKPEHEDHTSKTKGNSFLTALFGPVAGLLGDVAGSLKDVAMGAMALLGTKGLLGKIAGFFGGGSAVDAAADALGGGGRPGLMRRMAGGVGRLAGGALKLAGRAALGSVGVMGKLGVGALKLGLGAAKLGLGAAKLALPLAGKAVAAVASVLSAPVVIGAVVVGGLGYLAYRWITSYTPQELDVLRYMQYGLEIHDKQQRGPVLQLEEYLIDEDKVQGNDPSSMSLSLNEEDTTEILEMFGLKPDSDPNDLENFGRWFHQRFKPVFLTHYHAWKTSGSSEDFDELDDSELDEKLHILNAALGISEDVLNIPNFPYGIAENARYGYMDCRKFGEMLKVKFDDEGKKDKKYQKRKADYEARRQERPPTDPLDQSPERDTSGIESIPTTPTTPPALANMPMTFLTDQEREMIHQEVMATATGGALRRQHQYDIEVARIEHERRQAYMAEHGISEEQARASGRLPADSLIERRARTATPIVDPARLSSAYPTLPAETPVAVTPNVSVPMPNVTPLASPIPQQDVLDNRPTEVQQVEMVREVESRPTTLEQTPVATIPPPVQVNRVIEHETLPPNTTDIQAVQRQAEAKEQLKQQKAIENVLQQSLTVQREMADSLTVIRTVVTDWYEKQTGEGQEELVAKMEEDKGFFENLFGRSDTGNAGTYGYQFKHDTRTG